MVELSLTIGVEIHQSADKGLTNLYLYGNPATILPLHALYSSKNASFEEYGSCKAT